MEAFIKKRSDWTTIAHCLVLDYELNPSIYDTVSTIIIKSPETLPDEGDFIFLQKDDWLGVISTVVVNGATTELKVQQALTVFSRKILAAEGFDTFAYYEDYLKDLIEAEYVDTTDELYTMTYLSVSADTHTAGSIQPDTEDYLYSISSYAAKLRRLADIYITFTVTRTALVVGIKKITKTVKNIDFSNPDYRLTAENYSALTVGKINAYWEDADTAEIQSQNYYLDTDGNISTTKPATADRVQGEWIAKKVSDAEKVTEEVADEFAKNTYSHNIQFETNKNKMFSLYDPLRIRLKGKLFTSYVAATTIRKNSDIMQITCGELQVEYPYLDLI